MFGTHSTARIRPSLLTPVETLRLEQPASPLQSAQRLELPQSKALLCPSPCRYARCREEPNLVLTIKGCEQAVCTFHPYMGWKGQNQADAICRRSCLDMDENWGTTKSTNKKNKPKNGSLPLPPPRALHIRGS